MRPHRGPLSLRDCTGASHLIYETVPRSCVQKWDEGPSVPKMAQGEGSLCQRWYKRVLLRANPETATRSRSWLLLLGSIWPIKRGTTTTDPDSLPLQGHAQPFSFWQFARAAWPMRPARIVRSGPNKKLLADLRVLGELGGLGAFSPCPPRELPGAAWVRAGHTENCWGHALDV